MRIHPNPVFDVPRLLDGVHLVRKQRRLNSRLLAFRTDIPLSTVQLHLRTDSQRPTMISADYAARWMLWLGDYDIRDYLKED